MYKGVDLHMGSNRITDLLGNPPVFLTASSLFNFLADKLFPVVD